MKLLPATTIPMRSREMLFSRSLACSHASKDAAMAELVKPGAREEHSIAFAIISEGKLLLVENISCSDISGSSAQMNGLAPASTARFERVIPLRPFFSESPNWRLFNPIEDTTPMPVTSTSCCIKSSTTLLTYSKLWNNRYS